MTDPSLPSFALLRKQAEWLAPARARLLRRVSIARCGRVLDLGCGTGAVTGELARRAGGLVVALDRSRKALLSIRTPNCDREGAVSEAVVIPDGGEGDSPVFRSMSSGEAASRGRKTRQSPAHIQADAARLPFAPGSFDLVFCQFTLMWVDAPAAISEIHRVLAPGGWLAAIEPDYGGLIEHPPEIATRDLWLAALTRGGADASIGRKLPGLLTAAGFSVRVDLLERLVEPAVQRFELLGEMPLEPAERDTLAAARAADARRASAGTPRVAHLPVFLVAAGKKPRPGGPADA